MNAKPTKKVSAGIGGGSAGVVVVWALGALGLEVPPEVGAGISALVGSLAAWLKRE